MVLVSRLASALFLLALGATATAQHSPDDALRVLRDGNRRFAADKSVPQPLGEGVRRTLARGQSPIAIVLCCADSRVPPEHVFNMGLGELFVVRVAGHTCDPETLASIEYAVEHLNVPLCVVLGHEECGAVAATVKQVVAQGNGRAPAGQSQAIQQLLEKIEPAVRRARARDLAGSELFAVSEEENAHHTVQECLRRSDLLRRYASVGRFRMVSARYHLQSGEVEWLPARPLPADPVAENEAPHSMEPATVPPHVALRMLQAGHRRFLGDGQPTGDLTAQRREVLTHGQRPMAIVLTCADSRVAPEHVFDAGLGELFVIRVAGNTLNDDVLASIEYAAAHTGASLLVVMGHSRCGAIQAASEHPQGAELSPHLRSLLARLEPSVAMALAEGAKGADLVSRAVRGNVLRTVAESRSRSPLLRQLEAEGRFAVLPAVYDLATGDVAWLKDAPAMPDAAPGGETQVHRSGLAGHGEHDDDQAPGNAHPSGHGAAAGNGLDLHATDDHSGSAAGNHGHEVHAGNESPDADTGAGAGAFAISWLDPRMLLAFVGVATLAIAIAMTKRKAA